MKYLLIILDNAMTKYAEFDCAEDVIKHIDDEGIEKFRLFEVAKEIALIPQAGYRIGEK